MLLTIVNLFVFTPVAFLMWLFRYDPLAPGVRRDASSFWHAHVGRPLPKRQFADERTLLAPVGETHAPCGRCCASPPWSGSCRSSCSPTSAAGGSTTRSAARRTAPRPSPTTPSTRATSPRSATARGRPRCSRSRTTSPSVVDPFLGYRLDYKSSDLHQLVDGVRASYQSQAPGTTGVGVVLRRRRRSSATASATTTRSRRSSPGSPRPTASRVEVRNYGRPGTRDVAGARAVRAAGGLGAEARPRRLLRRVQRPRVADEPRARAPSRPTCTTARATRPPTPAPTSSTGRSPTVDEHVVVAGRGTTLCGRGRRVLGPERVPPRLRRARTSCSQAPTSPTSSSPRASTRPARRHPGTRTDLAGGAQRDLDPGRAPTSPTAVADSVRRRAGVLLAADRVHEEAAARRAEVPHARHATSRRAGIRRSSEARSLLKSTPYRRRGRRARRRDDAGALGLRAHQRGGRATRCRGLFAQPRALTSAAGEGRGAELVKILGISAFYHDSAAALVVDGELVAAAQEERFTRKKHDAAFPRSADRVLPAAGGEVGARRRRRRRLLRQADHDLRAAAEDVPARRAEGHPLVLGGDADVDAREALDPLRDRARAAAHRHAACRRTSGSPSTTRATPPARSSRRRSSTRPSSPSTASASGRRAASGVGAATASSCSAS